MFVKIQIFVIVVTKLQNPQEVEGLIYYISLIVKPGIVRLTSCRWQVKIYREIVSNEWHWICMYIRFISVYERKEVNVSVLSL